MFVDALPYVLGEREPQLEKILHQLYRHSPDRVLPGSSNSRSVVLHMPAFHPKCEESWPLRSLRVVGAMPVASSP